MECLDEFFLTLALEVASHPCLEELRRRDDLAKGSFETEELSPFEYTPSLSLEFDDRSLLAAELSNTKTP